MMLGAALTDWWNLTDDPVMSYLHARWMHLHIHAAYRELLTCVHACALARLRPLLPAAHLHITSLIVLSSAAHGC